jgi:hypothetical protein
VDPKASKDPSDEPTFSLEVCVHHHLAFVSYTDLMGYDPFATG